jgi:hypothetical protein
MRRAAKDAGMIMSPASACDPASGLGSPASFEVGARALRG